MFACLTTDKEVLQTIYIQLLDAHLNTFDQPITCLAPKFVQATVDVFNRIVFTPLFMPTAKKFYYQFNLRDLSKCVQNLQVFLPELYRNQLYKLYRLWLHECNQVYLNRLLFEEDVNKYMDFVKQAAKQFDVKEEVLYAQPIIYTSFISACQGHEKA